MFNPNFKKILKPRKEFTEKTKSAFLAVFDTAHPAAAGARPHGFTAALKALIAGGALVAIFVGMSVYADTANVAADSPLYPLKRLGESVQLAVTPTPEKAQLEATFADRRANEISDLETRKPSSTQISSLSKDLSSDLGASLSDAQSAKLGDGQLTSVCDKVSSVIATSSVAAHENQRVIGQFVSQCGRDATSNTTTATSTPIFSPRFGRGGAASSTASSSFPNTGIRFSTSTRPYRGSGNGTVDGAGGGGHFLR